MRPHATNMHPKRRTLSAAQRLALAQPMQWEVCETRLVLSAQLLGDWLGSAQLQMHQSLETPMLGGEIASAPLIEPQTAQAHQLSGWNAMQQEFGLRGDGQTVAVIDSGVAWDHVALGKGFGPGYRVVGGWDFAENDANPYDDGPTGFHGTHVSGIIGSDDKTYSGVAPGVDLVALRVFNDAGQGQIAWVEQALSWVHTHRNSFANPITTVNLSLGTTWNADTVPSWATLEEEFRQLYEDGIVVTASAGNSFKQYNAPGLSYPAASPYVLPVASVDDNGSLSDFSQRSERVLAAPGRNIMSTVPDHVLGRDGKINDFSTASGTSMAAPYVAGASVLVREAMEMVGIHDITSAKIINWLHDTADSVFDSLTNASYDRLNLQHAIDSLIPDDDVGDTSAQAQAIDLGQKSLSGWVNHLGDVDVYRFTAGSAGQMTLDADSQWLDSLHWQLTSNGQSVAAGDLSAHSLHLQAGQTYELRFSADHEIGSFQMGLNFQADPVAPPVTPPPVNPPPVNPPPVNPPPVVEPPAPPASDPPAGEAPAAAIDLGRVDYLSRDVSAGSSYHVTAMHDGIFTVQWTDPDAASGGLTVRDAAGVAHSDATWENGALRLDLNATAGQSFDIQLPGKSGDAGNLTIVDVLQVSGKELRVHDTASADAIKLDLSRQVDLDYGQGSGAVHYSFQTGGLSSIAIDGAINNDHLAITGSTLVDKVDLKPGMVSLENSQLHLTATGVEQVQFDSGSGAPDRVYLYDSDGDDTLTARPGSAELIGAGYRFSVQHVDRIFVHATGAGQDLAYLYDSAGDDQLSVRPQFTSLWGDGYFNSIRGFERVYVYATAGGYDTADLYDSAGDDRFSTGGEAASIVGSGFFSYTRYFEQVQAHATAGGHDVATLYGSNQETQWQRGSDFISFREANWDRNAQGFERVESYVNGLAHSVPDATPASLSLVTPVAAASLPAELAAPAVDTLSVDVASFGVPSAAAVPRDASDSHARLGDTPESVAVETANADVDHEQLSQLLVDVLEIQDYLNEKLAADELHWHTQPEAERELLDEIFSRYGL